MKVLLFSDADKDDLYSLVVLVAQVYLQKIEIIGIVCEDGFLDYPANVSLTQFWLRDILRFPGIPVYQGVNRPPYLKQQRNFPSDFPASYLKVMKDTYGYISTSCQSEQRCLDELIHQLYQQTNHSISILTTGNLTTLAWFLQRYDWFAKRIAQIVSMGGNYRVPGNVVAANSSQPCIVADAEFNFWLDPDSVATVLRKTGSRSCLSVCPLDATNWAKLDAQTVADFTTSITRMQLCHPPCPYLRYLQEQFLKLLQSTLATVNTTLYLWDLVATSLFLNNDVDQRWIDRCVGVSWTGRLIDDAHGSRTRLFYYVNYHLLIDAITRDLFS